jgi:parallel beta-helix repeat protein
MTSMHARVAIAALTLAGALASAGPAAAKSPPSTVKCGDTLTRSVKLTSDLTDCPADGLVIGAAGITVDLNGHTIDGTVTQATPCDGPPSGSIGIANAGGYGGLTIMNGTVQQFSGGFNAGSDTTGMADSSLHDLTVRDNRFSGIVLGSAQRLNNDNRIVANHVYGNGCGDGIALNNAHGNLVAHNRSHDNGGGITICCSDHNSVRDNLVSHNVDSGILVCCDSSDNVVEHNDVLDNPGNGIIVLFGAAGTLVRENHVSRNGNDIVIFEASDNTVARNRATDAVGCSDCGGPTGSGYGIGVALGANDNVVADNVVSRTRQDGIGILDFDPADPGNPLPNRTTVRGNVVRDAGGDGVRVDAGTEGTVIERNYAFGAADDGLHVDSAAAVLTGNAAFFNHDLGIEAVPGVTDGGGNRAHRNGNPAQCTGVACS